MSVLVPSMGQKVTVKLTGDLEKQIQVTNFNLQTSNCKQILRCTAEVKFKTQLANEAHNHHMHHSSVFVILLTLEPCIIVSMYYLEDVLFRVLSVSYAFD